MTRTARILLLIAVTVVVALSPARAQGERWYTAYSADGVPIAYSVAGTGDTTLVFVHGWSCDSRYWREQVPCFAGKYRVLTVDLAGHGHSGSGRAAYTMKDFGLDVKAAAEASRSNRCILIGHSMAGLVIAEAARLMPGRVIGIIGVDTIDNVEQRFTQEELDKYAAGFQKDFPSAAVPFVRSMMVQDTDPELAVWITGDMSAAPPAVAISAFKEMMGMYVRGDVAKLFDGITVPVRCVNADLWPVDLKANRRHIKSFDAKILKGRGHFLMLEQPDVFNTLLDETVQEIIGRPAGTK